MQGLQLLKDRWQRISILLLILVVHALLLTRRWLPSVSLSSTNLVTIVFFDKTHPVSKKLPPASPKPPEVKAALKNSELRTVDNSVTPIARPDEKSTTLKSAAIDWRETAYEVVNERATGSFNTKTRSLDSGVVPQPLTSNSKAPPQRQAGDSERFEDGNKRVWTSSHCYLTPDSGDARFREFVSGIPDRSGSKLTCKLDDGEMPSGNHMFKDLFPKK